jgi:putative transposase
VAVAVPGGGRGGRCGVNVRRHSQTGESPLERYARGNLREADPERLRHAFLWSEQRKVSRTATVSFQGNDYQTDYALRGRRVEEDES